MMTDGSNTSNANGVPIQGGSTGIYEDHPGLNPTDEMVVEYQAGIREQMSELMRMDGEHPEVVAVTECVHGESDNIAFLQGQLEDLRAHGRESEAFKIGVSNDVDLPGGGNPAGSSGGVDLANGNEAGSSAGVDLMNVDGAAGFAAESPLDQFGIHLILDLNIGKYFASFTNISLSMLLTLGLVLLLVLPMILRSLECRFLTIALCDVAEPCELGSQDAATPMMQGIIDLHHDIFFFLILILVFVSRMLVRALWHFNEQTNPIPQRIVHGTTIEIIWTIFPSVIPLFIAIPSFALLYSMDGVFVDAAITIKAIGHQWYRSAPLNKGDLSATKCIGGSRSI
jgi:hypothetical protein